MKDASWHSLAGAVRCSRCAGALCPGECRPESRRRLVLLATPRESVILGVGSPRRSDRFRRHLEVARVNVPRRLPLATGMGAIMAARLRLLETFEPTPEQLAGLEVSRCDS